MTKHAGVSNFERVRAVSARIAFQFPSTPEANVLLEVVQQAVRDAFGYDDRHRDGALRYLRRTIVHAEICGVDSEWIRRQIRTAGLCLESEVAHAV